MVKRVAVMVKTAALPIWTGCGFGPKMQPFVVKGCSLITFSEGLLRKGLLAKNAALRLVLTATLPFFH